MNPPPASAIDTVAHARALDRDALARLGAGALAGGAVGGLAAAQGGYFPVAWGWAALIAGWIAAVALVVGRRLTLDRLELAFVAALTALLGWIALSALWTTTLEGTINEVERGLVYVTGVIAFLAVVRRSAVPHVFGSMLIAATLVCSYSLATRLWPERLIPASDLVNNRLYEPLGYWNALGLFAAMGLLLAVGVLAFGSRTAARIGAGTSLVVFAPVLYFTFGRGAWLALAVAVLAWIAFTPQRLRLIAAALAVAPAPVIAIWIASTYTALSHRQVSLENATRAGHRYAWILLILLPAAVLVVAAYCYVDARLRVTPRVRLVFGSLAALAAVTALAAVFSVYGNPATLAQRGWDEFTGPRDYRWDLNERLFRVSDAERIAQWRAAWRDYEAHPWLGSGAGSYGQYWLAHRPQVSLPVQDADNLYLETLAELGPVGLGLLVAAFAVPFAAAFRARREPYVAPALAVVCAYLVHAGLNFDWEFPALTLAALFCAGVILVQARPRAERGISYRIRIPLLALIVACSGFAIVSFVANNAMSSSEHALRQGQWNRALDEARTAIAFAPWSAEAWRLRGLAHRRRGDEILAGAAYHQAIKRDPRNWRLWYEFAFVTQGSGREAALARARELNPNLVLQGE